MSGDDTETKRIRERLLGRQSEIIDLSAASEDARRPVELDQTRVGRLSRMDALQSQAMSQATDRRRQTELQKIKAALGRLSSGDYGYCLNCGEAIAPRRLDLDPTIALCIDCARQSDR